MRLKKCLLLHVLASASALSATNTAFAQTEQAADSPRRAQNDVIVVTGSLIQRPNDTAVSPILTVNEEDLRESGVTTIEQALNQFPSFTPAQNEGTGGQGTGGRATVNLHGLGSNRNLVLLDGRRLPLSDINGNVDINILPSVIIGGVDVITGGASAVYGSEAMSGVVNFKSVAPFNGVRVDGQYNISDQGDAQRYNASMALGTQFDDDRGNVVLALSYTNRNPLSGSDRSFFDDKVPSSFLGTSTFVPDATNQPDPAVVQSLFNSYGVTTLPADVQLSRFGFNDDGSLFIQNPAIHYLGPVDEMGYAIIAGNVRMPVGQQLQILNGLERKTLYAKADYDLTDNITLYGQSMYVDTATHTESGGSLTQIGGLTTIPVTNPFIPADLADLLASRPDDTADFLWNGRYVGVPEKNWDEQYTVQQYLGGVRGAITDGWSYDGFVSYDESVHTQTLHSAVLKSQVQTLLNAADGGASLCAGGFNPFGDANQRSLSQDCVNFISKDAVTTERLTQTQLQGQVNGELFDLGAGPVQLALLAGYRKNTYKQTPDSDLAAQNIEAVVASAFAKGEISVKEFAAQIDVPLIQGMSFIEELGVGAAGRVSDYSTTGSVTSYEFDARWRPTTSLLFRGSYQRAVRAPNIGELFSPPSGVQVAFGTPPGALGDPCDIRSVARTGATAAGVRQLCLDQGMPLARVDNYIFPTTATGGQIIGNEDLTPERANTFNVGFVFDSPWDSGALSNLSLSVDYYNIRIKNVISVVPGLTTLSKCYNQDGSNPTYDPNDQFCQLISRDVTGDISIISQPYLNLGAVETDGIEIQFDWSADAPLISQSGEVYLTSAIGWMNNYNVQTLPGTAFEDFSGTSTIGRVLPTWKALTTLGYNFDDVNFGVRWRYQSPTDDITKITTPAAPQDGVSSYNLFDLFGSILVTDDVELRAGVNNLFDKGIPIVASSQLSTDPGYYDAVGRTFYFGARLNF